MRFDEREKAECTRHGESLFPGMAPDCFMSNFLHRRKSLNGFRSRSQRLFLAEGCLIAAHIKNINNCIVHP